MRTSDQSGENGDAASKKSSNYRAKTTPREIASNLPSYYWTSRDARLPRRETVAFLGDRETPRPLSQEETGVASTSHSGQCKKPTAAISDSSAGTSCDAEDSTTILMGQTFNSLVDKDIPDFVRQHNTALSFPQKLMLMLMHLEKVSAKTGKKPADMPMGWLDDGLAFVIRDKEKLVRDWLPIFFKHTKFASFTRKLYRWQFRQVFSNGLQDKNEALHFGHENFQRDNKSLLAKMRSVTAEGRRREENAAALEQRQSNEPRDSSAIALGSQQALLQQLLQGQIRARSLVPDRDTQVPLQLGSVTSRLSPPNLQSLLQQQQQLADQAQAQLLQLVVSQEQATLQQAETAEASIRRVLVARLAAHISECAHQQPPPAPAGGVPQEQQLRHLLSILNRNAGSNPFSSPSFSPSSGPPPF